MTDDGPGTPLEYARLDTLVDLLGRVALESAEVEAVLREVAEDLAGRAAGDHVEVFTAGATGSTLCTWCLALIDRRDDISDGLRAPWALQ